MNSIKTYYHKLLRALLGKKYCKFAGGHPVEMITKWECREYQPMTGDYDPLTLVWDRKCNLCGETASSEFRDNPNKARG